VKTNATIAFGMFRFWWRLTPALALAFCLTGCVIIPLHRDSGYARTNVGRHTSEQFVPGQTTREDVIVALGEPDAVSRDERQLAYRSEKVVALWIVAGAADGAGGATGGTIYRNHFYVFEFDPPGRFQTAGQTGQWGMVQGAHEPELNPAAFSIGSSNGVDVAVSRGGYWLPHVDGFRSKGAKYIIGEPGELVLTESNLVFTAASRFGNAEPALKLPLTSVVKVSVDKYVFLRRLVVRTDTSAVHSFEICRSNGIGTVPDKPAMQAACDFIQSKIKPTRPEP
jgi:hypothetical protein